MENISKELLREFVENIKTLGTRGELTLEMKKALVSIAKYSNDPEMMEDAKAILLKFPQTFDEYCDDLLKKKT